MDLRKADMLLIEECSIDAELLIRALKKSRLVNTIQHMNSGAEALDFLFCTGKYLGAAPPDNIRIILLDIKMPKVEGIDVLARLKSHQFTSHIPVVMLATDLLHPELEKAFELGAEACLAKPLEFERFIQAIQSIGMKWVLMGKHPG